MTKVQYAVSGNVGLAGVTISVSGVSEAVTTDGQGNFSVQVDYGWSGTIVPRLKGYRFEPLMRSIPRVTAPVGNINFVSTLVTYTISGSTMLPGVKLSGFPEDVVSDAGGRYSVTVAAGWNGRVVPEKPGFQFEPAFRPYNDVSRDMKDDYKASEKKIVISGTAGVAGAVMNGLPGNPVAGAGGTYRTVVEYGWNGTVRPTLEGYEFSPAEIPYAALTDDQANQNYTARQFVYQISGSAGMAEVIMKVVPGEQVLTDGNGFYITTVPHGWTGTITPEKPGYNFAPKSLPFTKVTAPKEGQDFRAEAIQYTISGNAGTPGATMYGFPGEPISDEKGLYKAQVPYGWTGTVTPQKQGYNFTPVSKDYTTSVTQNQVQDFKATVILFPISGNAGQAGVTLKLMPGNTTVLSGMDGSYSVQVPYGWTGAITPQKMGYSFEPNAMPFENVLSPQLNQDFTVRIKQYPLSGRIVDESGNGVEGATIFGDNDLGSTLTDATGKFEFQANYNWRGKLTFTKEGYLFTPPAQIIDMGMVSQRNVSVTAKVRMMTISDRLMAGTEPIADVNIVATPGDIKPGKTNLQGVYRVLVPYGWTGELHFEKPGFAFNPASKAFTNVIEDMDALAPKTPPASTLPPATPLPTQDNTQPAPTPMPTPTPDYGQPTPAPTLQPGPSETEQQIQQQIGQLAAEQNQLTTQIAGYTQRGMQAPLAMTQRLYEIKQQMSNLMVKLNRPAGSGTGTTDTSGGLATQNPQEATRPSPALGRGPLVPSNLAKKPTLLNVLRELAAKTGVTIVPDMTVKPDEVDLDLSTIEGLPITSALEMVVNRTPQPYRWREVNDKESGNKTYEVFRPISNTYAGGRLDAALNDVAMLAGVPIVLDPNVTGDVNVNFENLPLEEALKLMLAGKPVVFKKTPSYYLIASRSMTGPSFVDISETRRVRLNYTQPARVKALLSPVFAPYVMAEMPDPRDPNDQGNMLLVTAAPSIVDRIVEDIHKIDRERRQVLLDARVVSMERGNLLNLGTEWSWPTVQAGIFTDSVGGLGGWPYGVQIGYTPDQTFTNSLMIALNLLEQNSQADIIANPKVIAQDGRLAEMRVVQEQWFMMTTPQNIQSFYTQAQLQKIESGTVLSITPYIGDNNDITLQMAVEVSDSIPRARGSDLPLVTRRTTKNAVTIKDGGTVAVAGLTENRSKMEEKKVPLLGDLPLVGQLFRNRNNDKASREVAVFVTAHLVAEGTAMVSQPAEPAPVTMTAPGPTNDDDFRRQLAESIRNAQ
jgi:hypothetical protein